MKMMFTMFLIKYDMNWIYAAGNSNDNEDVNNTIGKYIFDTFFYRKIVNIFEKSVGNGLMKNNSTKHIRVWNVQVWYMYV